MSEQFTQSIFKEIIKNTSTLDKPKRKYIKNQKRQPENNYKSKICDEIPSKKKKTSRLKITKEKVPKSLGLVQGNLTKLRYFSIKIFILINCVIKKIRHRLLHVHLIHPQLSLHFLQL